MNTTEWAVCFIGIAVAIGTGVVWLSVSRRRETETTPASNPGLIQEDATPGPPGSSSPAMLGALLDGAVEPRDLFLTIIDLAVRGFLRLRPLISEDGEPYDWAIRRTDKAARGLRDFELTMLQAPVKAGKDGPTATLSSLVNDTKDAVAASLAELRGAVARAGWFTDAGTAQRRKTSWSAIGGLLMLLGLVAAAVALVSGFTSSPWPGLVGAALMILSGIVMISLTRLRPTITATGDRTRAQVQRYRAWLQDLQPHDIAADTAAAMFDANIVPALAFGLEGSFGKVFDTAIARHRNWGGTLAVATDWLDSSTPDVAGRVRLLDLLLDDAVKLMQRSGIDEQAD